jgi:hypothetical protein
MDPSLYRKPQPHEHDDAMQEAVMAKLNKFRSCYIVKGSAKGLVSYFTVLKGDGDIRLVFDGTKSGLNSCIWTPGFSLPTVNSLLTAVQPETWMGDIDIGEQFYNFLLDPAIQPFCGIALSPHFAEM